MLNRVLVQVPESDLVVVINGAFTKAILIWAVISYISFSCGVYFYIWLAGAIVTKYFSTVVLCGATSRTVRMIAPSALYCSALSLWQQWKGSAYTATPISGVFWGNTLKTLFARRRQGICVGSSKTCHEMQFTYYQHRDVQQTETFGVGIRWLVLFTRAPRVQREPQVAAFLAPLHFQPPCRSHRLPSRRPSHLPPRRHRCRRLAPPEVRSAAPSPPRTFAGK